MKKFPLVLMVGLAFALWATTAQAATLYWVGEEGASTATAGSWVIQDPARCGPGAGPPAGRVPGPGDTVVFDADCDNGATVTADLTVTAFTMQDGYAGTVQQRPGTTVRSDRFPQAGGVYNTNGGVLIIGGVLVAAVPTPTPVPVWERLSAAAVPAGLTALATAVAVSALASLPGIWSTVLPDMIRGLFPLIGPLRRRQRPVGRVIGAVDGLPLAGVLVQIFDVTTNRLRETIVTGADGAFGTILPPGTYLFSVRKTGYTPVFSGGAALLFPGEQPATEQPITVTEEGTVVPLVFRMRRMAPYSRRERWRARLVRSGRSAQVALARLALPLLLGGALLNVAALWRQPSWLLYGITVLYLIFLSLELFISRRWRRAFGHVQDVAQKKPVALASIRLVDPGTKRIIQTRVTTTGGQYVMLAPRGDYRLQFAHPQYQALEHAVAIRPAAGAAVVFDAALTPRQAQ